MPLPFSPPVSLYRYHPFFPTFCFSLHMFVFFNLPLFPFCVHCFAVAIPLLALIVAPAVSTLW